MSVIYIVLPLAIIMAGAAVVVFALAVRGGQFDDLETPPVRVLFDDEDERPASREPEPRADR